MPTKFFKQRYTDRDLDTISGVNQSGSRSFFFRGSFNTSVFSATWNDPATAGRAPVNSFVGGKAPARGDSILFTDFQIPTHSKILGGHLHLTHSIAPSANHSFVSLDVAIFPDLQNLDTDKWRGKRGRDYAWIRNQQRNNERVTQINNDAGNFWAKIQEGVTIRAQTNVAAAAAATQGAMQIGRNRTDKYTGLISPALEALGQVVQIEASSAACDSVLMRIRRSGTFLASVNIVAKVYSYDITTRSIGALRATSDPVDASVMTTSTTVETTFSFPGLFSVTLNEYVFVSVEPETRWLLFPDEGNGFCIGGFLPSLKNTDTGANAAGSEEVMWCKPKPGGNQAAYFQFDQIPVLYSGASGRVLECTPYQGAIGECFFKDKPSAAGEVSILPLKSNVLKALENYNRDKAIFQDVQGVMWYLSSAGTGAANGGTLTWSNETTAVTGLTVVYRSTRTFIT